MTQTENFHRIVLIRGNTPATPTVEDREPIPKSRTSGQRIVIIRNGEFMARKRQRRSRQPG